MRKLTLTLLTTAWLFALAAPAVAHTAFASSDPADQAVLTESVSELNLVFEGVAEPAGDGFVILDSFGVERSPDSVSSVDNLTWVLGFEEPLPVGLVAVRWSVSAPDAHPIEGAFRFTISPSVAAANQTSIEATAASETGIDAFLAESEMPNNTVGAIGRFISLAAAMLSLGGVVFAGLVLRSHEGDIRSVLFWVRRASVLLGAGAIIELVGQLLIGGKVIGAFGVAIGLRLIGAGLLTQVKLSLIPAAEAADPILAVRELANVGASTQPGHAPPSSGFHLFDGDHAWHMNRETGIAVFGAFALLASYLFDGHTVTEGIRWITALIDVVHVAAGAIWAGGLVMLVHVVWRRHRRGADARALQLAVRFSVVAALALVTAGIAGTILTSIILDSPSDLWATSWGRFLLAKVAVVAAAGAAGGYNHRVLIPKLANVPAEDISVNEEFRRTATLEGIGMGLIILITALLVGAAT